MTVRGDTEQRRGGRRRGTDRAECDGREDHLPHRARAVLRSRLAVRAARCFGCRCDEAGQTGGTAVRASAEARAGTGRGTGFGPQSSTGGRTRPGTTASAGNRSGARSRVRAHACHALDVRRLGVRPSRARPLGGGSDRSAVGETPGRSRDESVAAVAALRSGKELGPRTATGHRPPVGLGVRRQYPSSPASRRAIDAREISFLTRAARFTAGGRSSSSGVALTAWPSSVNARPAHARNPARQSVLRDGSLRRALNRGLIHGDKRIRVLVLWLCVSRGPYCGALRFRPGGPLRRRATSATPTNRRRLVRHREAIGREVLDPPRDGVVVDTEAQGKFGVAQFAQHDLAQGARCRDERQDGRCRRSADDSVQIVLTTRATVDVIGQRRAQCGVQAP